jgi:ABC-2 type transport system ATP-binding protein
MPSKVSVRDLTKRYGSVEAARGVSFDVQAGEIFGLIGPNGAGKTTTIECVIGLREPDAGTIEVCGIDARQRPREVKERIGAALQTTALHDKITPREALVLFGSFYRAREEPVSLLKRFALADKADATFDTLSGGQRQRVALALAFVNKPELVFLDEPTAGLDPHARRELHEAIAQMKRDGHTVLLTTHQLAEAEQLCDRLAIIDRGRIIATGSARDLVARSSRMTSVRLWTEQPLAREWLDIPGVEALICEGSSASFRTRTVNRTVVELMKRLEARGMEIAELRVEKATLEDVFFELTGAPAAQAGAGVGPREQ